MEQLNKVQLRGTVGAVCSTPLGERISVATNLVFKDHDGNVVIETTWHNVQTHQTLGLKKMDVVEVVGRLRNQKYLDSEGNERVQCIIMAKSIKKLDVARLSYEE